MTILTSREAVALGYTLGATATGRRRVFGPDGTKYVPCAPERAELTITFRAAGLPPLHLKQTERPTIHSVHDREEEQ